MVINNAINNTVGGSNSGATNTLTVTNSSNTASSQALQVISVGGGTAGDPFTTFTVTGGGSWSIGCDNSASDSFVIANSTALGTTNALSIGSEADFTVTALRNTISSNGVPLDIETNNSSNTSGSDARFLATVAGSSAGDPNIAWVVSGGGSWAAGLDNSDSDAWVLSSGVVIGTSNNIRVLTTGGQYRGMNTNTVPPAGFIGEQITANASAVSLSNSTPANITSISLTAGIWDVTGMCDFAGAITGTSFRLGINTVSATMPGTGGVNQVSTPTAPTASSNSGLTVCPQRATLSGTTIYYLVAQANYTVGSASVSGIITATRVG